MIAERPSLDTNPFVEGLRSFPTLLELRASRFFAEHRRDIERLLGTPFLGGSEIPSRERPSTLRLVQWNIEKGVRFEAIAAALASHAILARADVIFLNEVDLGMARSGNRDVAAELATRLGVSYAFAPAHIELTKGVGTDLDAQGDNTAGLQGNAILSRWPLERVRVVALPTCFEPYHFFEKRFGRRVAIVASLATARGPLHVAGTHLEVRNTPQCRALQMRTVVNALPPRGPAVVAGDLNVSTFARGTFLRTVRGTMRLLGDADRLRGSLIDPSSHEPVFTELRRGGLRVEGWNTAERTIVERLDGLEDAKHLPAPVRRAILARLDRLGRRLEMRLDWFAGRQLSPSGPTTISDIASEDGGRASDHDPIVVDVAL